MNWKKGIKRIMWILAVIGGVLTAFPICMATDVFFGETFANMFGEPFRYIIGMPLCLLTGFVPGYLAALIICWLAYWLVCWIVKGFRDAEPKASKNNM